MFSVSILFARFRTHLIIFYDGKELRPLPIGNSALFQRRAGEILRHGAVFNRKAKGSLHRLTHPASLRTVTGTDCSEKIQLKYTRSCVPIRVNQKKGVRLLKFLANQHKRAQEPEPTDSNGVSCRSSYRIICIPQHPELDSRPPPAPCSSQPAVQQPNEIPRGHQERTSVDRRHFLRQSMSLTATAAITRCHCCVCRRRRLLSISVSRTRKIRAWRIRILMI
jgi:hypothetical protein